MKRILIVNAWGGNRGDEAMINTLHRLITISFSDAKVDLVSFRNEILDINPVIRQLSNRVGIYNYSILTPVVKKLVSILNKMKFPKRGFIIEVLLWVIRWFGVFDLAFLKQYDLIISAPQGPTISDIYTAKTKTLYPLYRAAQFNIPYVIMGVSMGPFDAKTKDERYVYSVLSKAVRIVVREDISLQYVKKKYPALDNIISSIDLVYADLLINDPGKVVEHDFFGFSSPKTRPLIGACISMTPARSPKNLFDKQDYIQKMILFFDFVIEQTGGHIVLFPHLDFDMPYLNDIIARSSCGGSFSILPPVINSDGQQAFLKSLDFFISSRYHPTIFAIKAGLPIMCIINQFKAEGMLQKLGLNLPVCWQDEPLSNLKKTFESCWIKRDEIRKLIKSSLLIAGREAAAYQIVFGELVSK